MSTVAALLALVLAGLAILHLYWGFGGVWPGTDEKSCARAIVGAKGIERMPGVLPSFAVAVALLVVAIVALALARVVTLPLPQSLTALAGIGAALVFIGRGVAGFTPHWRRLTPEMPFARNDRHWFSPLCLLVGAALSILLLQGFAA